MFLHIMQKFFEKTAKKHLTNPQKSAVAFGDQSRRDVPAPRDIY